MRKGVDFCDIFLVGLCGMWFGMYIFIYVNLLEKVIIYFVKMIFKFFLYIFFFYRDGRKFLIFIELILLMFFLLLYFERFILFGVKFEVKK